MDDNRLLEAIQGKTILIVDDNAINLRVTSNYLERCGIRVLVAHNGESAVERAQNARPDIILLDIMLPGINGFEVCRQLKAIEATKDIPIIFMTVLTETKNKIKGFEAGGVDYVTKPIQYEELLARVTAHLRIQQFQSQLIAQNNLLAEKNDQLRQEIADRKKIEESLQKLNRELALLHKVGQMFSSSLDLNQVLETALEEIQRLFNVFSASFWLIEPEMNELVCRQAKGPGREEILKQRLTLGQGITGRAAKHGESQVIPDIQVDKRHMKFVDDVHSMASIPLRIKGKVIGVLNLVDLRIGHFTQDDLILLEPIASEAAIAIENARLYTMAQEELAERKKAEAALEIANRELQRLASLDGLTHIANRRWFDEYLHQEWQRNARQKSPLSLILCDVDYFKPYNDTYGHQAGDECLQQLARAMSRVVHRPADFVARYGGEEFVIILPDTEAEGAIHLAQALQKAVQTLKIPHSQSSVSEYVTLSLGVACIVPDKTSLPETLIAAADEALYEAKETGRNRTVLKT